MSTHIGNGRPDDMILRLFRAALREQIFRALEKDTRPIVEAAADEAIKALDLYIVQHADQYKMDMTTELVLRWQKEGAK